MQSPITLSLIPFARLALAALLLLPLSLNAKTGYSPLRENCTKIRVKQRADFSLSNSELRLVCGDDKISEWANIPLPQAESNLRAFLQAQGFHKPNIEIDADILYLDPKEKSYIKDVQLVLPENQAEFTFPDNFFLGKGLTTASLDQIQASLTESLFQRGYPCAKIEIKADTETSIVTVEIKNLQLKTFNKINRDPIADIDKLVLPRFDAFTIGQEFDSRLLELTRRRAIESGIVQNAYFTHSCKQNELEIHEHIVETKARTIRVGAGANTEESLIGRASWRNAHLGDMASSIEFSLQASQRVQRFKGELNWYLSKSQPNTFLRPEIKIQRKNERKFESFTMSSWTAYGLTREYSPLRFFFSIGPAINYSRTLEGFGRKKDVYLSFDSSAKIVSHELEYYSTSPRSGYMLGLFVSSSNDELLSPFSATRVSLTGKYLWNSNDLNPPKIILGWRMGLSTVYFASSRRSFTELPPSFRHFLGGSQSLRGFSKDAIPNDPVGALTTLYFGFEMRSARIFHPALQPYIYLDIGAIGDRSLDLQTPIYWSPGVGLRWESPVGAFRASVARGSTLRAESAEKDRVTGYRFNFSFGEEF